MKIEQYLKEGIEYFNKGPHRLEWGKIIEMNFIEFPKMMFTLPLHPNKKKEYGDWFFNGFTWFIWITSYLVVVYWIKDNYDFIKIVNYLLAIILIYFGFVAFSWLLTGFNLSHKDTRLSKRMKRVYRRDNPDGIKFSDAEYKEAAEVLRKLKPMTYNGAVKKYSEKIIDLLLISSAAMIMNGKVRRLGSIKAIEEDREAGPDDE